MYSYSMEIEYSRSVRYSMELKSVTSPTRFSKWVKTSKKIQEHQSSDVNDVKRRVWSKRQRVGLTQTQAEEEVCRNDFTSTGDTVDIISREGNATQAAEDDEEVLVELLDIGVDHSDEEKGSDTNSVASGPSVPLTYSPMKLRTHNPCSACRKLYQKARKTKSPLKDKLLDNDPTSLTCDQWVLIKTWRSHRLFNTRGKLSARVQLIKKHLHVSSSVRDSEGLSGEAASCSRPHAFLQRNLRRCTKVTAKSGRKKNRRKRRRQHDSQGSRRAKQQRLHGNKPYAPISVSCSGDGGPPPDHSHSDGLAIDCCSSSGSDNSKDEHLSFEVVPTSVSKETTGDAPSEPKPKAPKRAGGFKDLLAQLRGTNSAVVREMS